MRQRDAPLNQAPGVALLPGGGAVTRVATGCGGSGGGLGLAAGAEGRLAGRVATAAGVGAGVGAAAAGAAVGGPLSKSGPFRLTLAIF